MMIKQKTRSEPVLAPSLTIDTNSNDKSQSLETKEKLKINIIDENKSNEPSNSDLPNESLFPSSERIPFSMKDSKNLLTSQNYTKTNNNNKRDDLKIITDSNSNDGESDMNMAIIYSNRSKPSLNETSKDRKQDKRYTLFHVPKETVIPGNMISSGVFSINIGKAYTIRDRRRNYLAKSNLAKPRIDLLAKLEDNDNFRLEREDTQVLHIAEFSEEIDNQNMTQKKARDTLKFIRKVMKKETSKNQTIDRTIKSPSDRALLPPLINYTPHISPQNHIQITKIQNPGTDVIMKRKAAVEVADPSSLLHMANYAQNHDFSKYTEVSVENNKTMLKLNVADSHTFFRLQHEICEMKRKEEEFRAKRLKHMMRNKNSDLTEYDKRVFTPRRGFLTESNEAMEDNIKSTKAYKKGLEIGKLLKPEEDMKKSITTIFKHKLEFFRAKTIVAKYKSLKKDNS